MTAIAAATDRVYHRGYVTAIARLAMKSSASESAT